MEDATVVFVECFCKAGKGGLCSHTSSVMTLLCHYRLDGLREVPENVSSTSQIQRWHRPRGSLGNCRGLRVTSRGSRVACRGSQVED